MWGDYMESRNLFKKIYFEITNICNLSCPFCLQSSRKKKTVSIDEFKYILKEIKPYTKYLYFHVLGEPLLHNNINEFIDYASNDFYINITTNGYLINNIKTPNIRQINISLHSFSNKYDKSLDEYLDDIFKFENTYSNSTYVNYRLWVENPFYNEIIDTISKRYNVIIPDKFTNIKLTNNVFISSSSKFDWPQDYKGDQKYSGACYALKDHIAILSDGSVTACCLDGNGVLSFGNIFKNKFKDIILSNDFIAMKKELTNGIRKNELCKKCNFLFRD